jgi:GNAT superfamily N-acetyltransferase
MAVRRIVLAPAPRDPAALAFRLERAEAEQLARTGAPGPAGALPVAGGLAVSKGPRSPSSSAFGLGLLGPLAADDLDRVEAHLGALGGEVRIELCAHADPALAAELGRRGYRIERFLLVLSRAVAPAAPPGGRPAGRVRSSSAGRATIVREVLRTEARAFADAFGLVHLGRAPAPHDAAEDLLAVPLAEGNACFAAFDGRSIVGVGVVSDHGRVATLSGAGVVPQWRGRGLHLALVRARLAWAARRGCDVASSAVEPGGASQRTLERAGFRVAYPKAVMLR